MQLELPFEKTPYDRFRDRVCSLLQEPGTLRRELRTWAEHQDLTLVASWTRRLLRELPTLSGATLLDEFSHAFRGDEVGHLGRDLLTPYLHASNPFLRSVAVHVLVRWLEYDEDGMWLDMVQDHLGREKSVAVRHFLRSAAEQELEQLELVQEFENVMELESPSRDNPLLEHYFEVRRNCELEVRGTAPVDRVGPFIVKMTGIDERLMANVVELLKPHSVTEPYLDELGFYGVHREGTELRHLWVWSPEGTFAFSIEPTATEGRVLLFCYVR